MVTAEAPCLQVISHEEHGTCHSLGSGRLLLRNIGVEATKFPGDAVGAASSHPPTPLGQLPNGSMGWGLPEGSPWSLRGHLRPSIPQPHPMFPSWRALGRWGTDSAKGGGRQGPTLAWQVGLGWVPPPPPQVSGLWALNRP